MPANPKPLRKQRNPKPPPVEYQFKPGVSGNPGGRPKRLSDAYKAKLAEVDPKTGLTNAELVADAMVKRAKSKGGENAAKELRQATEGDKIVTWQDEVIELLKSGKVTPEEVQQELGEDAAPIIIAAGVACNAGATAESESQPESTGSQASP